METKTVQIEIPEYLSIRQYMELQNLPDTDSKVEKALFITSILTGIDIEELKYWDLDSIKEINNLVEDLIDPKNEFHSLIEWNGTLYGYSNVKQQTLGEYIDLENFSKDINNNLHKVASILYRPIVNHKFDSLEFMMKHNLKVVRHKEVANIFDYYDLEKYDSNLRKKREEEFLDFPVLIVLGAISFFLVNANQYLNNIVYSQQPSMEKKMIQEKNRRLLESLTRSIGGGGGLYTHSLKPVYLQLQGTKQSQISTL